LILRTEVTFLWRPIQKISLVPWPLYNNSLFPASAKPVHPSQPSNCNVYYGLLLWFSGIWLHFLPAWMASMVWDEVRLYFSHMEIFLAKRKNDQFCSGSVLCIARGKSFSCPVSLLKSLLVKAGSLGKHVPVFRKSFAPQISPGLPPLLELAFCKLWLILLTCPSQILLTDTACTPFSLSSGGATLVAKEGVPDNFFRRMEPGGQARPCTRTLRGLLPIICFQSAGPCTTKPRL
jgi:hypothetical protein